MKINLLILALAAGISTSASGALVAAWDLTNTPSTLLSPQPAPWDSADHVTVSNMTLHGSVTPVDTGSPMIYAGWGTSIDTNNYVGFTVTPAGGYTMTLTDLFYGQSDGNQGGISYEWGYRINGGAWVLSGETLFDGSPSFQTWTFTQPVVTADTVEVGFFASMQQGANLDVPVSIGTKAVGNEVSLNGTVVPVPEPSAVLLGAFGALAAMTRRRKMGR